MEKTNGASSADKGLGSPTLDADTTLAATTKKTQQGDSAVTKKSAIRQPEGSKQTRATYIYLRQAGQILMLVDEVIASACVYLHKYLAAQPAATRYSGMDVHFTAVTCLFLASKVHESPRRIRSIINVHQFLRPGREAEREPPFFPQLDDAYWATKERIIGLEQDILRALAFDVEVTHPYKYLSIFAEALGCPPDVIYLALSIITDSYSDPAVCLQHSPQHVATAALYVAARVRPRDSTLLATSKRGAMQKPNWWEKLGTSTKMLNVVGAKLADASFKLGSDTLPKSLR